MKNLSAMTNAERQALFRDNLALKNAKRLSITISQEAANALQAIQNQLEIEESTHTKRAAIETALIALAKYWAD